MILITGATGYIGSHIWLELLNAGYEVLGIDNFANSTIKVLRPLEQLSKKKPLFEKGDICDPVFFESIFSLYPVKTVIHLAGLKSVKESVLMPFLYYKNNLGGTLNLIEAMKKHGCRNLIFSSSATVYGENNDPPFREDSFLQPVNPYGHGKLAIEQILNALAMSDSSWRNIIFRYFNPVGAHPSGLIGEQPNGVPNNLIPVISEVVLGRVPRFLIYGDDWATPDGTCIRDYIHVVDIAKAHLQALDYLSTNRSSLTLNLGAGKGYSVKDLIKTYEMVSGRAIPFVISGRRLGDVASSYCNPKSAEDVLGWRVKHDLVDCCKDSWRWYSNSHEGV